MNINDLNRARSLFRLMSNTGASPHEQARARDALTRLCNRYRITLDVFESRYMIRVARFVTSTYVEGICAAIVARVYGLDATKLPMHAGAEIVYRGPPEVVRAAERLRRHLLAVRLPRVIVNHGDGTESDISTTPEYRLGFFADLYQDIAIDAAKRAALRTMRSASSDTPGSAGARMPDPDADPADATNSQERPAEPTARPAEPTDDASPGTHHLPRPAPYNLDGAKRGYSTRVDRFRVLQEALATTSPVPEARRLKAPPRPPNRFHMSYVYGVL